MIMVYPIRHTPIFYISDWWHWLKFFFTWHYEMPRCHYRGALKIRMERVIVKLKPTNFRWWYTRKIKKSLPALWKVAWRRVRSEKEKELLQSDEKKTFAQSPKNCSQDLIEARHCLIYLIHKLTKRNHLTQIYLSWAMARHSRIWQTFNRECFSVANFSSANLRLRQSLPDPSLQL